MKLGEIEIISVCENKFKIDAASVFGVIPKVIWEKIAITDEFNRIALAINTLIIKSRDQVLIVDTGFGDILSDKQKRIFGVENASQWDEQLSENQLKPEDITGIIFSHLHADHALGALKKQPDGSPMLRFPNARLYAQKREWNEAINPNERTAATYHVDKLRLFEQSGKLGLVDGDTELFPGIALKFLGGHTPGTQGVIIDGGGQRLIYPSDIMPLVYNLRPVVVGAVDLDPITTMNQKRWLIDKMLKEDWIIAFDHDIEYKYAKFIQDETGNIRAVNHA